MLCENIIVDIVDLMGTSDSVQCNRYKVSNKQLQISVEWHMKNVGLSLLFLRVLEYVTRVYKPLPANLVKQ